MENQAEKVYVKVNQKWQRATVTGKQDGKVSVMTNDGQSFNLPKNSKYFEPIVSKGPKIRLWRCQGAIGGPIHQLRKTP